MPTSSGVTFSADTQLSVSRTNGLQPAIGFDSIFDGTPHPGTGNLIEGWEWDQRVWASELELNNIEFAPTIWDPSTAALREADFQSGVGGGRDAKILQVNEVFPSGERTTWAPIVNHGDYFIHDDGFYLYSDSSVTQIIPEGTLSGVNLTTLDHNPKDGIPISVTKWKWNQELARYDKGLEFEHKFEFTGERITPSGARKDTRDDDGNILFANIDDSVPEFVVDSRSEPFTLYLNSDYIEEHGVTPSVSGLADMELLGVALGIDNEEFNTQFSPTISGTFRVVTFFDEAGPFQEWTIVDEITTSGQATFDYDLGVVKFGEGEFFHPAGGEKVAAYYKSSVSVEYEIDNTIDTIRAIEADVNPMGRTSGDGFLYLKREIIEPFAIQLEAEAPLISPSFYGPVFLGTGFLRVFATVTSRTGEPVEGAEVTFFQTNGVGSFSGGATSVTSDSNFGGIARTTFNIPRDVSSIGGIGEVVNSGFPLPDQTTITLSGVDLVGDATKWQIYKVWTNDPVLGVDSVRDYYIQYFEEEAIYFEVSGVGTHPTAQLEADGTGWENTHRLLTGLLTPTTYNAAFRNGRKQLVVTYDDDAIDPHTGEFGAFVPLRPLSYAIGGDGSTSVIVSGLLEEPGTAVNDRLAGYFIAGPTVATLQASVYNERLGQTIFSNEIEVEIRVPPSMDGTVLVESLNEVQKSGIFEGFTTIPTAGTLPLGFRLRSTGVTLAGVLGGLTYLDVNRPTEVVGHAFEVVDSGVS